MIEQNLYEFDLFSLIESGLLIAGRPMAVASLSL